MARWVSERATRSARRFVLVALLGVLAVGVWGAFAVFAAAAPPAPTLTAKPANPTNSTSAAFSYSDSQSGVTFSCTLDAVAKTCPGSVSAGTTVGSATFPVAAGSHTFSITATSGGKTSSATTYTWTVDTTLPTVSAPAVVGSALTSATSVSWTVTFSESVKNVVVGNFTLGQATNLTGAAVTGVSGSGASYTVTANTGSLTVPANNGTLRLDLANKGSGPTAISDLAGNPLSTGVPLQGGAYTIDRAAPPAPSIGGGPSGTVNQSSATFNLTDTEAGVSFLCKLDAGVYTACSATATFSGLADGSHTLTVEAKDAAGNVSSPSASRTWTVDTTPPPKPTILGPNNKSDSTAATFTMSDSEAGVTYKCSMDGSPYVACPNPVTYTLLTPGTHEFDAEAVDQVGNIGPFNGWKWTINGSSGSGQDFTISIVGTLPKLYPGGATDSIDLSLYNPNSVPIYVTSVTIPTFTVTKDPAAPANLPCTTGDFVLTQLGVGANLSSNPITLNAGQTKTLSAAGLGAYLPTIKMLNRDDLHPHDGTGNQDGCKNATLNFTFGGSAQS